MRKLFYLISMVMVSAVITGCGPEQALRKAEKHYAIGEYYDAAAQYKKAYSKTPSKEREKRGQLAVKMAECYRRINSTNKAITAYKNVIRNRQADSLTHLRLAQQLMKSGNYKEAAKNFQIAIDSLSDNSGQWRVDSYDYFFPSCQSLRITELV